MKNFFNIIGLGVVAVQEMDRGASHTEKYLKFKQSVEKELMREFKPEEVMQDYNIGGLVESDFLKMKKVELVKIIVKFIDEQNEIYRESLESLHSKIQK